MVCSISFLKKKTYKTKKINLLILNKDLTKLINTAHITYKLIDKKSRLIINTSRKMEVLMLEK